MDLSTQITWLFMLSIPVACIAWTVTQEEIFKEPREYCIARSQDCESLLKRKLFYLFTCEYCFSHYVAAIFLVITEFHFLFTDWRGYLLSGFSIVWIANFYMSLYALIRIGLKKGRIVTKIEERKIQDED
ncbi:hypothetical protein WG906_09970 [Pedobacter sp. P351]|uniref:hypothetical protein n=1 Tax=Pedobacter superstes TaxID=3133441 RepID=UPI0030B01882